MHKWMAKAAGGTSQRLKRGPAMVRSLANNPGVDPPDAGTTSGTTVIDLSPCVSTVQLQHRYGDTCDFSPSGEQSLTEDSQKCSAKQHALRKLQIVIISRAHVHGWFQAAGAKKRSTSIRAAQYDISVLLSRDGRGFSSQRDARRACTSA
jgi:hypothetical protein